MVPSPEELSNKEKGADPIYDQPGNRPSSSPGGSAKKKAPGRDDLGNLEHSGGDQGGNGVGSGNSGGGDDASWRNNVGVGGLTRSQRKWLYVHRKKVLGGGITGTILGLVLLFSTFSGPLQFLQFGSLLKQFHLSSQNNTQDDRFMRDVRYIRGRYNSTLERTRMGYLGNKLADSFEAKLNASGLKSAYSPRHQLFDGYTVDRTNEKFKNMTDEEIKAYFKQQGIDVLDGSTIDGRYNLKGELVIRADSSKVSFFKNRSLNKAVLKTANVEGLMGAIGSRLLCKRAGCTLHPLKILSSALLGKNEERLAAKKQATQDRVQQTEEGVPDSAFATAEDAKAAEKKAIADGQKISADATLQEVNDARANSVSDPSSVTSAKDIIFKGGGLAVGSVVGVACIAKGVADKGASIKQAEVRLPLIRMGVRMIAIADQIKSGQGVDGRILAQEAQQLHGIDGSGKNSSWFDSQSIQANLGNANAKTGVAPDATLQGATDNSTPFDFFKQGIVGAGLDVVCSTAFSIISFLGAGLEDLAIAAVQQFFTPMLEKQFVSWASGQAIDANVVGGDLGNYADYGMALAANDQSIASGGIALSSAQSAELNNFNSAQYTADFSSKSLISKIFSTSDPRSAISRVIDHSSSSPSKNIAAMFSGIMNFGHSFGSLFKIFSPPAIAAQSAGYDYGFPTFGFGAEELSDPAYGNPEANAVAAEALLDPYSSDPAQSPLVQKAARCFGVTIAPETVDGQSDPQWGVTVTQGQVSDITQIPGDCATDQSSDWKTIRFFILDTETVNSMACYVSDGSDPSVEQACTDAGFSSATDVVASGGTNPSSQPSATPTTGQPTVVIDPGHGPNFTVVDSTTGLKMSESDNVPEITEVWDVAQKVKAKLVSDGYNVLLTKKDEAGVGVTFRDRANVANYAHADIAISIHDDHTQAYSAFKQIYPQEVGLYRGSTATHNLTKFTDAAVAQKSQQYAQIFKQERQKAEGGSVSITINNSFGGRGLEPGNIPMVQLFADVPWIYNEVGAAGNLSPAQEQQYANGLINSIEKAVPVGSH